MSTAPLFDGPTSPANTPRMNKQTNHRRGQLTDLELQEAKALKDIWARKRSDLGLTQEMAGAALSMNQSAVSQYLNGKIPLNLNAAIGFSRLLQEPVSAFSPRLAEAIKNTVAGLDDALRVAAHEALSGSKPAADELAERRQRVGRLIEQLPPGDVLPLEPWDSRTPLDDDEVEVPLFKEIEMSAGPGSAQVVEINGRKLRFSRATMRAAGVDENSAACATLSGNSMEPLILDGSTIGIDRSRTKIVDGELYAIDHDGLLRVKHLYRLPGGGIRLRSENAAEHPDEQYDAEKAKHIRVLGWVFWWSTVRKWRGR